MKLVALCGAVVLFAACAGADADARAVRVGETLTFHLSDTLVYRGVVSDVGEPVPGFRAVSGPLEGGGGFFTVVRSRHESFLTIGLAEKVIEVTFDRKQKVSSIRELRRDDKRECALAAATGTSGSPCISYCTGLVEAVSGDAAASETACGGVPPAGGPFHDIEIAVVYTNGVRAAVTDRGAMSRIATAIEWTNIAFRRSGIRAILRPARTPLGYPCIRHIPHNESEAASRLFVQIEDIVHPLDTDVDELPAYRDRCKADLLVMVGTGWVDGSGIACRMIRLSPNHAPFAFAVVDMENMSTDHIFTHEIGHLLGAGHAATPDCRPGMCSYSQAALFSVGAEEFETVVGATGTVDNVLYFSGPSVFYDGTTVATGTPTADNARTVNIAAPVVADFR